MKTEHFWQLFFVFVGAFSSAYAGYYFTNQPQEKPVLTYEYIESVDLNKTLGETGDITMIYKGKELKNLTKHLYTIANLSAKDLGTVKLHFEFDGGVYPAFYTIDENKLIPRKAVRLLSNTDGSYIFELDFMNSVDRMWNGLVFEFYFIGDEKPNITLKSGVKGLSIKEQAYTYPSFLEYLISGLKRVWWLVGLATLLLYMLTKYEKHSSLLAKEKLRLALNQAEGLVDEKIIKDIQLAVEKEPSFIEVIRSMKSQ
ncbi:hypothetical protein LCE44_26535 [Vibrio harveyi]|uniref:hypothetical protein n=1 Tax=Vibrio harveyi TaxID=669 RepID=UPI003BF75F59